MSKILLADDDNRCREAIRKVLEREGHTVLSVAHVDRALEALERAEFDLVICDYRMPDKSGLDLLIEMKRHHSSIPVLMISADLDPAASTALLDHGVRNLLKKPIRRRDLVEGASRILDIPSSNQ